MPTTLLRAMASPTRTVLILLQAMAAILIRTVLILLRAMVAVLTRTVLQAMVVVAPGINLDWERQAVFALRESRVSSGFSDRSVWDPRCRFCNALCFMFLISSPSSSGPEAESSLKGFVFTFLWNNIS